MVNKSGVCCLRRCVVCLLGRGVMNRAFAVAMVAACPFPYPRGTPARIYRMAEALIERGHTVHVVTYHLGQERGSVPFPIHRTPAVPTYRKTEPGPSYQKLFLIAPLLAAALLRGVRTHPVDLIHAHHYEGLRSEERREGNEGVCTDISRRSQTN